MKTTVIYHRADFDGIFCREIARKFLPGAEIIGWDFADDPLALPDSETIYVMDLPVDRVFGLKAAGAAGIELGAGNYLNTSRFVWIDHHKSSIETHPTDIAGYRLDGVAACRLAWQWFEYHANPSNGPGSCLPYKEHFLDRKVDEPLAVRLAGEYDIWDKRDPRAELFQHGLRSQDLESLWELLLVLPREAGGKQDVGTITVEALLDAGKAIQYSQTKQNESVIKEIGFTFQWEGLTFMGCNASRYNSHLFTAGLKPEHDGCFGFKWTGKEWSVSLYGVPGKPDIDLSQIAVKYGGGGHKQACGFRTTSLPFIQGGAAAPALP